MYAEKNYSVNVMTGVIKLEQYLNKTIVIRNQRQLDAWVKKWEAKMKKVLVTGGTVFVSKFVAEYNVKKGYEVYVLNRNTKSQAEGVKLIEGDRNNLGNVLKGYHFDIRVRYEDYRK